MNLPVNPTELLKEYFFKALLIQQSTKMIDENWGENISRSISNFIFTDPLNVAVQTDKDQVSFFNKLLGTSQDTIQWSMKKNSQCSLDITEKNKKEIIPDILSQIYCLLSVSLFENLVTLLKKLCSIEKNGTSFQIINEFYDKFKYELRLIDQNKVDKTATVLGIHNLRIFRNCITHANPSMEEVEKKFDEFNLKIKEKDKTYSKIHDLGELRRELLYYSFDPNRKRIFLSPKSFNNLLDFYSQIAYIAYLCYCNKFEHKVEIE
ncbi:hypothetical protein [Mucilaginibacter sp. 22184]|uniref:hypothetical protein n=1 Tax=Mucilaginibacter sp. 22184 TaxID=3453887 RepID=UPI003F82A4D4